MIYLIGGGLPWSKELNVHLLNLLKGMESLLLVPTSIDEKEKTMNFADRFINNFKSIGINFKIIHIVGMDETLDDIKINVQKSDCVFFMGGNPEKQIEWCKRINIKDALVNYNGIIMGTSAGAMTLSKKSIITKGRGYTTTLMLEGLEIAKGMNIKAHYDIEDHDELIDLVEDKIDSVFAIPEGCAIVTDNNSAYYVGNTDLTCYLKQKLHVKCLIQQTINVKSIYV